MFVTVANKKRMHKDAGNLALDAAARLMMIAPIFNESDWPSDPFNVDAQSLGSYWRSVGDDMAHAAAVLDAGSTK